MAGIAGRMRNKAPEDGIWDSCGSVGGAGCCLWREWQSSDSCESTSAPGTATPIQTQSQPQIPSQGFNLCSIFAHSPVSGHQPITSNWMFWAKMGRKVERVKRKNPNPKAMDPAGIHPATGGALAASQRSGWNGPSLAWRRFSHHFLGCRIGWFPGKRWEL